MITTVTSFQPLYAILVSAVATIPMVFFGSRPNLREAVTFIAAAIKLWILVDMSSWILSGNTFSLSLFHVLPNVSIAFTVDAFGLLFAFVASILWIPTSVYSMGYMRPLNEHAQTRFFCCFALALSATLGVAFSANLLTLYMFYELLSLSTYALVTHHQDNDARVGGRKYLVYLMATSIGLALPAMVITYNLTGTLTFSEMGVFSDINVDPQMLFVLFFMFIFGFSKAGLMPFHSWLPGAMVAPTPVSSLLHAVAVVKVGVFCILRVITGVFGLPILAGTSMSTVLCIIASITVVVSSLIALSQDNLKRRLAFSTIGQLSYITLAAGLASKLGVTGSMLHIAAHAFGKITLFFCAGAIFVATGRKYISDMVGIGRQMPLTMLAFFVGSLSVIGLPPAAGLISKWLMLGGALEADKLWVVVIYLLSSLLNAAYFLPIVYRAFFVPASDARFNNGVKEAPIFALIPPIFTALMSVILFFFPGFFLELAQLAVR